MRLEPPILAVLRGELVEEVDKALFPARQAGHPDQPALIGGEAQHQGVARPRVYMDAYRGQRRDSLAGEQVTKDIDVAAVACRTSVTEGQCGGEGLTHGRKIARELKGAGFADMGQ